MGLCNGYTACSTLKCLLNPESKNNLQWLPTNSIGMAHKQRQEGRVGRAVRKYSREILTLVNDYVLTGTCISLPATPLKILFTLQSSNLSLCHSPTALVHSSIFSINDSSIVVTAVTIFCALTLCQVLSGPQIKALPHKEEKGALSGWLRAHGSWLSEWSLAPRATRPCDIQPTPAALHTAGRYCCPILQGRK